jgi:ATP adenylyltransferase
MSLKPKNVRESFREGTGLTLIDAPWRHKYFDLPKDDACFICRALDADPTQDAQNLVLLRGERALIMLNRFPYTMGALMVVPHAHVGDYRAIDDETLMEMNRLVKQSIDILENALNPKGFNIGINQGVDAGAGLKDHLHIHVVPRWGADTNFMTVTAGTRVLAENVDSMYRRLRKSLRALRKTK